MNWLAHLFLSDPTPPFRVGSILPDIARPAILNHLPADFQSGIARHHQVDRFTDSHPIVRQSISLFPTTLRRYAGILIDIFYDHFLACDWPTYSSTALPNFIAEIYTSFDTARPHLPAETFAHLKQIQRGDWISTYHHLSGISEALTRLAGRLKRPFDADAAMSVLEQHRETFQAHFELFYRQVIAHITPA